MSTLTKPPTVSVTLLIRRPPTQVFKALADPSQTSQLWWDSASPNTPLAANMTIQWTWSFYNVSTKVYVLAVEQDRLLRYKWESYDCENPTTVEWTFTPYEEDGEECTYVKVTEEGFTGDGDRQTLLAAQSTGGYTFVLCAVKAYVEFGVKLQVVKDAFREV